MGSSGRTYLTRMGFRSIITNRTMSIASVLVLVSCLMLVGLVTLLAINLNTMFAQFSSRNVVMAYLVPGLEQEQIEQLQTQIESLPTVRSCVYISSEEAFSRMMEKNAGDYELLQDVDPAFMPAGFEVSPASQSAVEGTVEQLNEIGSPIETVRHFQGITQQLSAIEKAIMIFGVAIIGLLLIVSIFIISSTVRATMHSRQQEIQVMKSVGAAPSFIRWPFLVEGVALGLLGSAVALGVVFLVYLALDRALDPLLERLLGGEFRMVPFKDSLKYLLPGFFVVGVLTGAFGSAVSIRKYLKEKVYEKSELEEA